MDHVAIMRKEWGLLEKIVHGEKTIESRWCRNRSRPWGHIKTGDTVYFKNSGEMVSVRARVAKVLQFSGLLPATVRELLDRYGEQDGIEAEQIEEYFERFREKRYGILVFLVEVRSIEPFQIDKRGFGAMAAWLSVPDIEQIRGTS